LSIYPKNRKIDFLGILFYHLPHEESFYAELLLLPPKHTLPSQVARDTSTVRMLPR